MHNLSVGGKMPKEFRGKEDKQDYQDWIATHSGFVANCWRGVKRGGRLHRADCYTLVNRQDDNPTENGSAKIWAATEAELDDYAGRSLQRCSKCMKAHEAATGDHLERESHQVIQGGRIESNRRRH